MSVDAAYLLFCVAALAVFRWRPPAPAALGVFVAGWLVLPVGHFPAGAAASVFPYWITGLAMPSDMLLTKAWVAPAAALLGALVFDRATLARLRPVWADLPMLLWCAWPLLRSIGMADAGFKADADADPAAWRSSLYLAGAWGLPWLLGRLYCASPEGRRLLLKSLAIAGAACLPFSLIEGLTQPQVYGWVFEPHPFRNDGAERYWGARPLGFFENGNQFGLWVSLCALAAVWLAFAAPPGASRGAARFGFRVLALVTVSMAVAAQSVGAILLLGVGLAVLAASRFVRPRVLLVAPLVATLLAGAVYVSGVVPITQIGKETAFGQRVIGAFRAVGRGSFTWRIGQDQKFLADAMARPLAGAPGWDWWRPKQARPWGLALLVVGQFGLVGLALGFGAVVWPALLAVWQAPRASAWRAEALPLVLAVVIALTMIDALMNAFLFFPALVAAGGLAGARRARADDLGRGARTATCRTKVIQ